MSPVFPTQRCGLPEWDGQAFALDDARIPPAIRQAAAALYCPGHQLFFANTKRGGEWWLMDEAGELVETFWLE